MLSPQFLALVHEVEDEHPVALNPIDHTILPDHHLSHPVTGKLLHMASAVREISEPRNGIPHLLHDEAGRKWTMASNQPGFRVQTLQCMRGPE